jgi:glutaconyl-CoA/methylmalonyl-CoA decarboxylase subunit gamma
MRKFKITVNGVDYEVEVEELTASPAAVHAVPAAAPPAPVRPPAAPAPARPPAAAAPAAPAAPGGVKNVTAPMPGTLLSIAVKPGDKVTQGQLLCVLEAMKMENEIKAGADGTVVSVAVAAGDAVNTGQVILQLS